MQLWVWGICAHAKPSRHFRSSSRITSALKPQPVPWSRSGTSRLWEPYGAPPPPRTLSACKKSLLRRLRTSNERSDYSAGNKSGASASSYFSVCALLSNGSRPRLPSPLLVVSCPPTRLVRREPGIAAGTALRTARSNSPRQPVRRARRQMVQPPQPHRS